MKPKINTKYTLPSTIMNFTSQNKTVHPYAVSQIPLNFNKKSASKIPLSGGGGLVPAFKKGVS